MKKWFKHHYRITSVIFLGIIFIGWTAFINADESDRILKQANEANMGSLVKKDNTGEPTAPLKLSENASDTDVTDIPGNANDKDITAAPENTLEGDVTAVSENTSEGDITAAPENTSEGDITATPENTSGEDITDAPNTSEVLEVTQEPEATIVPPAPTEEPVPTEVPTPTPVPTEVPTPTPVPVVNTVRPFNYAVANVNDRLNIRSGAGDSYSIIGYLKSNAYCEVLERGSEWTKIKSGSLTGYAFSQYLIFEEECIERLRQLNKLFVKINAGKVNIRSAANTECDVIAQASEGKKFVYLPEKSVENWYCIQYSDTQVGYVSDTLSVIVIETEKAIPIS